MLAMLEDSGVVERVLRLLGVAECELDSVVARRKDIWCAGKMAQFHLLLRVTVSRLCLSEITSFLFC